MEEDLKYKTKKALYWSFINQAFTYGMSFAVGIAMARMLTPEDYGITALPAVFMAIARILIDAGLSAALVRKPEVTEEDLSTAFYYSIGVGVFCYLVLFFTSPLIAQFYHTPVLTDLVRITSLVFLWGPLGTPQTVLLQRKLNFKTPARISIINKVVSSILGISAALMGYGLWALVISTLASSFLEVFQLWLAVRWYPKARWSKESFKYLWGFGNKMIATYLINTLYANIGPVFMGRFSGAAQLGDYNRAKQYVMLPSSNVAGIITNVTLPVMSQIQDDDSRLEANYRRMIRLSGFVLFPVMMLLAALARPLVILMVTEKWEGCIYLMQILCFVFMWQPIHILNMNVLQVKGRTDLTLKLEIVKKTLGTVLFITALNISVVAFCYADLLMSMIALFINTYYTGKLINVGYWRQMADLLPSLLLGFVMFGAVLGVNTLFDNYFVQLAVGGILGVAIYVGGAFLFKFDELKDVKYLLNRKK